MRHEPGFADAAINLATAGAKVGNPELGRNAVERALQNDPNNVELQDTLRTLGSESVSAVQAAVTEPAVPTSAEGAAESGPMTVEANPIDACIAQGRQLLQAGETSQASQVFLKAIELDPTNATAWNDLGVALYTGGEMTAAMEAFSTALRHDDQFVDPALNMVPVGKALNCEEQVLQVLNAFLAIDPLNEEVRQAMNGLLGGENVTAEAQRQTRAMELMATGRDHLGRQEYAEAGKVFLQATEEAPGFAPPWNDLGVALYLEEHSELAYQAFQTALQMSPAFADAALNFSKAGERLGRTEEPIEALKRVLAEKPSEADVAKRLGELTGEVTPEAAPAPTSQPIVPQAAAVPSQAPVVQESVEPDVAMDWVEEQNPVI